MKSPPCDLPIVLCGDFNSLVELEGAHGYFSAGPDLAGETGVTRGATGDPWEGEGEGGLCAQSSLARLLTGGALPRAHPQHPDAWAARSDIGLSNPRLGTPRSNVLMLNDDDPIACLPAFVPLSRRSSSGDIMLPSMSSFRFRNVYQLEEFAPFRPLFTTKVMSLQGGAFS